ncbi:MAG: FG-GAP-like repeat-containing protein [Desulfohalobiaceae bacterium]
MHNVLSHPSTRLLCSALLVTLVLLLSRSGVLAQPKSLAVLPFEMHAGQEYEHLKEAIPDMFASRVAQARGYRLLSESRIKALEIDPSQLDEELALEMGKKAGADAVVYGSLTMLEGSWSLDANLLQVTEGKHLGSFSRSGSQIQDLIPGLEEMAGDMRSLLQEGADKTQLKADSRQKEQEGQEQKAPYAGFEAADPDGTELPQAWSGPEMERNLTGLAAGDTTGDEKTETVLVDKDHVYIYSLEGNRFQELAKVQAPGNSNCIAVDVGDINGNGQAEIFVSAKNNRGDMLRSFVLEYTNGDYKRIQEKEAWFYKVTQDPEQGGVLLGQKHQREADPFQAEIVRLTYQDGKYAPEQTLAAKGSKINVLSLAQGRIREQASEIETVGINSQDRLKLLGTDGNGVWSSREAYGGSTLFMQGPSKGQGTGHDRFYLPGRTLVFQPEEDQPTQVFTFKNQGLSPIKLQRLRTYKEGEVVGLAWDGESMQEEWKTKTYDGHFRDLALGDLNNDGGLEVAALLIRKQGLTMFSSPLSQVLIFPLQPGEQEAE